MDRGLVLILIVVLIASIHSEVVEGKSIPGCFLRGLYGIDAGACE